MVTLCPSLAKGSSEPNGEDESMSPVQHLLAALVIGQGLEPDACSGGEYANEAEALLGTPSRDLLGRYRAALPS
jgi:hypothetical protein